MCERRSCRLTGGYRFEILEEGDIADYGHIRQAELIEGCVGIPFANEHVGEGLQRTRRNIGRLWRLDHLRDELELLLSRASSLSDLSKNGDFL